ncbi:hypothetical protein ACWCSD_44635, partial [Nonomuraea sp. NPDC001684]
MNVTPIDLTEGQRKLLIRIRDHTVITGDVNTLWGDWTRRAVFKRLAEQGLIRDERDDLANGYRWHVTDAGRAVLDQIAEVKRARALGRRARAGRRGGQVGVHDLGGGHHRVGAWLTWYGD